VANLISNTGSIVIHDPDFARVYTHEKRLLLGVMLDANPRLRALALAQAIAQPGAFRCPSANPNQSAYPGNSRSTTRIMASKYSRSRSAREWRSSGLGACTRAMTSSDSNSIGLPVDSAKTCARQTRSSLYSRR
jgi:hypothetical protein